MVSVDFFTTVLPAASFCRDSLTRVMTRALPSTLVLVTGRTLPPPQRMLPLSWPPSSCTPSHPAPPPGIVSAHRPMNGFSAARTDVVRKVAAPTMVASRRIKDLKCMGRFYPEGAEGQG